MYKKLTYKGLENHPPQFRYELAIGNDEVNKSKSSFLSNVSHDICSPMNAITEASKLLNNPSYNQEQVSFFINEINKKESFKLKAEILSRYFKKYNINQQFVLTFYHPNLINKFTYIC